METKKLKLNLNAILIATFIGFVVSSIWYIIFGNIWMELRGLDPTKQQSPPIWRTLLEIGRTFILTCVLAYFVSSLNIMKWKQALQLGLILWIGFPIILLSGSIIYENVSWKIALIHSGDWLLKPLAILFILTYFNRKNS